ncbi:DMT family transporter [Xenorhabdus taiwanensis]|uniref:EamA domain-containing protein n=1 Tax=Xenorhabdus taiwanensis TaxID=3085177 RepID=A0ABM8JZT4_9GAMM|nr:hypothetical protein TCT1_17810 [Xenorhabdus sp. TCT-1]
MIVFHAFSLSIYFDKKILDKNQLGYYFNLSLRKDTFFDDILKLIITKRDDLGEKRTTQKDSHMSEIRSIHNMLLTALAPIVWGSTYIITTEVLPPNMPLLASTVRALPAGILLLLICRTMPKGIWWLRIMVLSLLNISAFFYFLFVAAGYLPGGTASLITACQPIIVILLSTCIFKTSLTIKHIISAILGIIGISLLVLNSTTRLNWQGVIAGFVGCSCMALGVVLTKYWNRPTNLSLLSFTGW